MSLIRNVQSLGRDCLLQDALTELPPEAVARYQIYRAAQKPFEVVLKVHQLEQADGTVELDQEVDVALRPRLAASRRPEEREGANTQLGQLGTMIGEDSQDVVALHVAFLSSKAAGSPILARSRCAPVRHSPCRGANQPERHSVHLLQLVLRREIAYPHLTRHEMVEEGLKQRIKSLLRTLLIVELAVDRPECRDDPLLLLIRR